MLRDGGSERPRTILSAAFVTAGEVIVYDRFFRRNKLDAIVDAMEFAVHERGGPLGCIVTTCVGMSGGPGGAGYLDYSTVPARLSGYVERTRGVRVEKVVRSGTGQIWLHDRFIQIDEASTFVFTAGIGCFFERGGALGRNRSCHIFECAVGEEYEEFEFYVADGSGQRRRCIRM
jgi:hypothetical protein